MPGQVSEGCVCQVSEKGSVFGEYLFMKHLFCNNSVHVVVFSCECVLKAALSIEATTDALPMHPL